MRQPSGIATPYPEGFIPPWARALAVWGRFAEQYPGYRCGSFVDEIEGPIWVDHRANGTVRVQSPAGWWSQAKHRWVEPSDQPVLGL